MKTLNNQHFLTILLLALIVRFVVFIINPYSHEPYDDSAGFDVLATNLLEGNGFSFASEPPFEPTALRTPVYPLFLALIYLIFGRNFLVVKFIQCIIGAFTCILIYLIAKKVYDEKKAYIAGMINSIYPAIVLFSARLLSETLFSFLLALSILTMFLFLDTTKKRWIILSSILMGISSLCRPDAFLLPLILLPLSIFHIKFNRLLFNKIILAFFFYLLILFPWIIRNYCVFGKLIPLTSGAGKIVKIYDANSNSGILQRPERDIYLDYLFGNKGRAETNRQESFEERQKKQGGNTFREKSADMEDEDIKSVSNNFFSNLLNEPLNFIKLGLFRFYKLWQPRSWSQAVGFHGDFVEYYHANKAYFLVKLFLLAFDAIIILMGWFGMIYNLKSWRKFLPLYITIIYFTLVYSVLHGIPRYRIPIMPFVLIFSADTIYQLWQIAKNKIINLGIVKN